MMTSLKKRDFTLWIWVGLTLIISTAIGFTMMSIHFVALTLLFVLVIIIPASLVKGSKSCIWGHFEVTRGYTVYCKKCRKIIVDYN